MSFQEVRTELSLCNRALSRIKQQALSGSLLDPANQNKLSGRECLRWYKPTVRYLLERHHFGLATKRVALAQIATNLRSAEWLVAYQRPSDMAFPVNISPFTGSSQVSYYAGLGALLATLYGRPLFRYEGETIFAQVANAELDYVSFDITEADFTQSFEDLVVLFLSSHLARSVAKDDALADNLKNEAVGEFNLAIANNLNMNQPRYGYGLSEAERVRDGGFAHDPAMGFRY